ncbi:MAG: hypothetical protein ACFFB3_11765 [Candidatus Hodarchaeota archaeon]
MSVSESPQIEEKLEKLERTNNKLRIFIILAIFLFLFLAIAGFSKNEDEIVANKITLLYEGKPCFSIKAGTYYKAGPYYHEGDSMIISDKSDTDRTKILLNSLETKLSLFDGVHDIAGVDLFSTRTYCGLFISNRHRNVGKFWIKDGEPTIELFSDKGRPHFRVPK